MAIKMTIHQKHIVSPILGSLNKRILSLYISCIKEDNLLILICLASFNRLSVILNAEILILSVLQKAELHGSVAELLIRKHSVLDKEFEIIPLLLKLSTLISEYLIKAICHLLSNICRDLLNV